MENSKSTSSTTSGPLPFDSCCDDMELMSLLIAFATAFCQKIGHDVAEIAVKCTGYNYIEVRVRACSESDLVDEGTRTWTVNGNANDPLVTHFYFRKDKAIADSDFCKKVMRKLHFDTTPRAFFGNNCEPVTKLADLAKEKQLTAFRVEDTSDREIMRRFGSMHEAIGQGQFRAESIGEYLVKFIESNEMLQVRRENHETNLQIRRENHETNLQTNLQIRRENHEIRVIEMKLCHQLYIKVTKKREQYERRHKRTVKWFGYFMKNKEMLPFDEWWIRHSPARFDPIMTLEKYLSMYISAKNRNIDVDLQNEPLASPNAEQPSETEPLLNNCA